LLTTDFTTANRVVDAINSRFGPIAAALDGRVIQIRSPQEPNQRVAFLAKLEGLVVSPAESTPKVIVNARTGSVVMNQSVQVDACAIAHGNLTVTITTENTVAQPAPMTRGRTQTVQNSEILIQADKGPIVRLPKATSLRDVVRALNAVGATPQDLLAILQAMKAAGSLKAELEVI
jgi:flagellar P-ring protein precursor FlgI